MIHNAPKLAPGDSQLVMRELYEQAFGIADYNKEGEARPYLSIAMHDVENASENSLLDERIDSFLKHKVGKHFNISLIDFLQLPTDLVLKCMQLAEKAEKENIKQGTDVVNSLESLVKPT